VLDIHLFHTYKGYWNALIVTIHSVVCLTTGPHPLPMWVHHTVPSSATAFNFQYPLFCLISFNGCLCLLPHLPITSILCSIFPLIMHSRQQFLWKMWSIQLACLHFVVCRIFLSSLTVCNTSLLTQSVQLNFFILRQHHTEKLCSKYSISLASSLNVSKICHWESLLRVLCCFCLSNPEFNSTR